MKMSRSKSHTLIVICGMLAVMTLLPTCSSDDEKETEEPTSANISGAVVLYDEQGMQADNEGMTVTIEGSSPEVSTTTDAAGEFELMDVDFGTYTLVYEKSGYGTYKLPNLVHEDNGSLTVLSKVPSLSQLCTTEVTSLTAIESGAAVVLSLEVSPDANNANPKYVRYFFSEGTGVSRSNYSSVSDAFVVQIEPYEKSFSIKDFMDMEFSSETTVYAKVYGDSFWSNSYDGESDLLIFPNLNVQSADEVSFVVP